MVIIPKSDKRQLIDDLISKENIFGRDANPFYDAVGELEGISIFAKRDYQRDYGYRCVQYVFSTIMNESWLTEHGNKDLTAEFWTNTIEFLNQREYILIKEPQKGDIIGYRFRKTEIVTNPYFKHFGIWLGDKVRSKFEQGHIFEHEIDVIPNRHGEEALFFRKEIE
jgi:hypothetical protein